MSESKRAEVFQTLESGVFDVIIIGGGINGAVAAAALSASHLRVAMLERGDFASCTSQESSNLVWGGIKYLESYEFGLVWDLCRSRNELRKHYPQAVEELRFFTCIARGFRKPRILVFLGAVLYWIMGRCRTRLPRLLSQEMINREEPLVNTDGGQGGLEYSDCILKENDARFVFNFIRRALKTKAVAVNYVEALSATRLPTGHWQLKAADKRDGQTMQLEARVLINAGGPYADAFNAKIGIQTEHHHIFSKGVHLIVPKIAASEKVLTFFADDGRLFFVIPMADCSCIGTTDTRVTDLPAQVTEADREFILSNINKRLRLIKPLCQADIIAERCGVRPLVVKRLAANYAQEEWVNLSRKHVLEIAESERFISIFGGKMTDCLNIGREVIAACRALRLPVEDGDIWYGEGCSGARTEFFRFASQQTWGSIVWPGEGLQSERLWRLYGEAALEIGQNMEMDPQLGEAVVTGSPVLMSEIIFMAKHEMIVSLEDLLRRRTRLSLTVKHEELLKSQGLRRACEILFAQKAGARWQEYFGTPAAINFQTPA